MIRTILKKIIASEFIRGLRGFPKYLTFYRLVLHDAFRYTKYSSTFKNPINDEKMLAGRIAAYAHTIEKGLSLKDVRPGFGKANVFQLVKLLKIYKDRYGIAFGKDVFYSAMRVLKGYLAYNEKNNADVNGIKKEFQQLLDKDVVDEGGAVSITKKDIFGAIDADFDSFVTARHSIRNFTDEEVKLEDIKKALKIAQKAPSVCNRQSSRVYIVTQKEHINVVLDSQAGARGFSHLVAKLIVVSSDLRAFHGVQERNQAFVDAGIYSMLLLLALHYVGLGACPLCWFADLESEKEIRRIIKIKDSETIMLCIAVGHIPNNLIVAESKRYQIEDILNVR